MKNIICFALILLLACAAIAHAQTPEELVQQAKEAYQQGDYNKSTQLYEQAARAGSVEAMLRMGDIYVEFSRVTSLVPRDNNQAAYWYEQAANAGDVGAMVNLGYLYNYPDEFDNPVQAVYWFEKALAHGAGYVKESLALLYMGKAEVRNTQRGLALLHESATQPDGHRAAQSMLVLGWIYKDCSLWNCDVPVDLELAFAWFSKAAEGGNTIAMAELGYAYEFGRGVRQDYDKAYYWYDKSGFHGEKGKLRVEYKQWQLR